MFRKYEVRKFKRFVPKAGEAGKDFSLADRDNNDHLSVVPFKGYSGEEFKHRGYGFFLREGFKSASGLRTGTFVHDEGWGVVYDTQSIAVPPKVQITVHVDEAKNIMELERTGGGGSDLRSAAAIYKQAITEKLDQFYVLANNAYQKKMNRAGDTAAWDGWEFLVRGREYAFVCVMFLREYIPPLCDTVQHVAVILRCPAETLTQDTCEVVLDECRFVADSLASTGSGEVYTEMIQARLDSLQCTEETYRWLQGHRRLRPVHHAAGAKFVKSIVKILLRDGQIWDETLVDDDAFRDVPTVQDPLMIPQTMISDTEPLLASQEDQKLRSELRSAWRHRIARYLAYCVDGGIMGERFTMATLVQAMIKGSYETDRLLRAVLEFLLQIVPHGSQGKESKELPLAKLMLDPEEFGRYSFNESVMKLLLSEGYMANEWQRRAASGTTYDTLLAALLKSGNVGLGIRTLICRQMLERTCDHDADVDDQRVQLIVSALVKVMQVENLALASCATAALVNLSCGKEFAKTLIVSEGGLQICVRQLRTKDDDLTLYTLYLLVNLTKTAHHRSIFLSEGGMPLIVDILTSSYQNLRKQKILAEIASVIGQLCSDHETRGLLSDSYPVVPCLLWINDIAKPNTKLKAKMLFALRQLSHVGQIRMRVGKHAIPKLVEELSQASPKSLECLVNIVLLLQMLARIQSNVPRLSPRQFYAIHPSIQLAPESQRLVGDQLRRLAGTWQRVYD